MADLGAPRNDARFRSLGRKANKTKNNPRVRSWIGAHQHHQGSPKNTAAFAGRFTNTLKAPKKHRLARRFTNAPKEHRLAGGSPTIPRIQNRNRRESFSANMSSCKCPKRSCKPFFFKFFRGREKNHCQPPVTSLISGEFMKFTESHQDHRGVPRRRKRMQEPLKRVGQLLRQVSSVVQQHCVSQMHTQLQAFSRESQLLGTILPRRLEVYLYHGSFTTCLDFCTFASRASRALRHSLAAAATQSPAAPAPSFDAAASISTT